MKSLCGSYYDCDDFTDECYLFCISYFSGGKRIDGLKLKRLLFDDILCITDEFYKGITMVKRNPYLHNNLFYLNNFRYIEAGLLTLKECDNIVYLYVRDELLAIKLYITVQHSTYMLINFKHEFDVTLYIMYVIKGDHFYINCEGSSSVCMFMQEDDIYWYKNQSVGINYYLVKLNSIIYFFLKRYSNIIMLVL